MLSPSVDAAGDLVKVGFVRAKSFAQWILCFAEGLLPLWWVALVAVG